MKNKNIRVLVAALTVSPIANAGAVVSKASPAPVSKPAPAPVVATPKPPLVAPTPALNFSPTLSSALTKPSDAFVSGFQTTPTTAAKPAPSVKATALTPPTKTIASQGPSMTGGGMTLPAQIPLTTQAMIAKSPALQSLDLSVKTSNTAANSAQLKPLLQATQALAPVGLDPFPFNSFAAFTQKLAGPTFPSSIASQPAVATPLPKLYTEYGQNFFGNTVTTYTAQSPNAGTKVQLDYTGIENFSQMTQDWAYNAAFSPATQAMLIALFPPLAGLRSPALLQEAAAVTESTITTGAKYVPMVLAAVKNLTKEVVENPKVALTIQEETAQALSRSMTSARMHVENPNVVPAYLGKGVTMFDRLITSFEKVTTSNKFGDADKVVAVYGGKAAEWEKLSGAGQIISNGTVVEAHFWYNTTTKQLIYDHPKYVLPGEANYPVAAKTVQSVLELTEPSTIQLMSYTSRSESAPDIFSISNLRLANVSPDSYSASNFAYSASDFAVVGNDAALFSEPASNQTVDPLAANVPVPASILLLIGGFVMMAATRFKTKHTI